MGLFTKYRITTAVSSSRIMDDVPDILPNIVYASNKKEENLTHSILIGTRTGFSAKTSAFFRYGEHYFTNGLPEGFTSFNIVNIAAITKILTSINGAPPFEIETAILDFVIPDYIAYEWLALNHSYNWDLNISDIGAFMSARLISTGNILIKMRSYNSIKTYHIYVEGLTHNTMYYHIMYRQNSAISTPIFWNYNPEDGTYPSLDIKDSDSDNSPYFPIVPVRENQVTINAHNTTELYKTSKKLLNKIDIKIDDICDAINENDQINEVHDSFIMYALDINTPKQESQEYLSMYWEYLAHTANYSSRDFYDWLDSGLINTPPINIITIKDNQARTTISFHFIDTINMQGNIGRIGFTTYKIEVKPRQYRNDIYYDISSIVYERQVTLTTYIKITVVGIYHQTEIEGQIVIKGLADALNEDETGVFFPIHRDVSKLLPVIRRTAMYYDALLLVIYAYKKEKLKWYETGIFKLIIKIVAIVITVYSFGTLSEVLAAAWAISAVAVAILITEIIIIGVAVRAFFSWVISEIGGTLALILSAILLTLSFTIGTGSLSIKGAPFAEELLMRTSALLNRAIKRDTADQMADLMSESIAMQREYEEQMDALKEVEDELSVDNYIDPMASFYDSFTQPMSETSDAFYNRTIHNSNPGVLSIDAIASFVDLALTLPKPNIGTNHE